MNNDRIEGAAKDLGGKIEEIAAKAFDDEDGRAAGVRLQIEGKAQKLYGQTTETLSEAGERTEHALRETTDIVEQVLEEGRHQTRRSAKVVQKSISDHPTRSLLLALSAGFIAGVLIRRI